MKIIEFLIGAIGTVVISAVIGTAICLIVALIFMACGANL
jgi:hypothetical protein